MKHTEHEQFQTKKAGFDHLDTDLGANFWEIIKNVSQLQRFVSGN